MAFRAFGSSVLVVIVVAGVTGCSQQGTQHGVLTLSASEATLQACPTSAPVVVADLSTKHLPSCTPVGQQLIFPDGEQLQLPEQSGGSGALISSDSRYRYVWQSVGNWGIVAARATEDCSTVQEWGNPEALRRVHEAFGITWACP